MDGSAPVVDGLQSGAGGYPADSGTGDLYPNHAGDTPSRLTVLSFGAGQDSTAILHMLLSDPVRRRRFAPHDLVVAMSDTGDELPETLVHVAAMRRRCEEEGVPFTWITPDLGFHSEGWQSLTGFYRRHTTIGSKAYPKTCTDRLKIQPFYRWLEQYVVDHYGVAGGAKKGLRRFVNLHGRIRVLIGIGAEEAKRRIAKEPTGPAWMRDCIEKRYPLVELGMSRADCIAFLRAEGQDVPMPSNCMRCHFASEKELLWLASEHPQAYAEWVELEAAKLAKHAALGDKNLGVFGKRTLPQVLEKARMTHPNMTPAELRAERFTHGHCVKSAY